MSDTRFKASLLASTMITGLIFAAPARAQDAASQDSTNQEQAVEIANPAERVAEGVAEQGAATDAQDIVVTGSRIVRRDLETAAPVAVVQDEEFKLSGTVNVEQVINTLPQALPGGTAFSNNPGGGVATLNLRGLGSTRTLVLVNGRRYLFFDAGQVVDLNTIPAFLIDSVDVVTGGASAVYGSDAVAGVVNFRLRNDIDGVEVGGQYSITSRGDGPRYNAHIALGGDIGDRGHATVFGEYYKRGSVFQGDRGFSRTTFTDDGEGGFTEGGSSTNVFARIRDFFGSTNGEFTPGGRVFRDAGGNSSPANASDLYNYAPANFLMVPQERYLIGGYADYDVGGGHTPFVEATFVNNRVENELAPTPVTGLFDIDVATACQFVNATECARLQRAAAASGDPNVFEDAFVQRRIEETGPRNSLDERNAFRILGGIRGPITDRFNYEAYYSYARTRNSNIQEGNISRSAFAAGLDGTGTPINIFGPGTL
ncbi:MAG: TonB-dependent receptor plug domain-containing protein, partial [Pseudomonadota bacterium]|nr:TonB-dependent receptor plug domain-containing protein [Pseudomonadota bacterium]